MSKLFLASFTIALITAIAQGQPSPKPSVNRTNIQSQIDTAVSNGGGTVAITYPGIYNLDVIDSPYNNGCKTSLTIGGSNIHLVVGVGVVLRLADNQKVDNVQIFLVEIAPNTSCITIDGGGRLTGNTAGQPGYTQGYSQGSDRACLIRPAGKISHFTLRDLTLDDIYSCAVDTVNLGVGSGNWNEDILLENLLVDNTGEGIQIITGRRIVARNLKTLNTAGIASVGDSFELAACENFVIDGIYVENYGSIDLFGSKYGILTNFIVRNCSKGVDLDSFGNVPNTNHVVVSNGLIEFSGEYFWGIGVSTTSALEARSLAGISIANITIRGHGAPGSVGIAVGSGSPYNAGPISISNISVDGVNQPLTIFSVDDVVVNGLTVTHPMSFGLLLKPQGDMPGGTVTADQTDNYHVANITGDVGILNSGYTGGELTGVFENIKGTFTNDNPTAYRGKITVRNLSPSRRTESYNSATYYGVTDVEFTGTLLSSLRGPSEGQIITFHFPQTTLVWGITQHNNNPDGIDLVGGIDQNFPAGSYLTVKFNGTRFVEIARR